MQEEQAISEVSPEEQLAHELQKLRQNRGKTCEDISSLIRISIDFIKALETGNINVIPGEVFGRGFIRCICKSLDVECNTYLVLFERAWAKHKSEDQPRKRVKIRRPYLKKVLSAVIVLSLVVIGTMAYFWGGNNTARFGLEVKENQADLAPEVAKNFSDKIPTTVFDELEYMTLASRAFLDFGYLAVKVNQHTKVIEAVDQGSPAERTLEVGSYTFQFHENVTLEFANIEHVEIRFQGKPVANPTDWKGPRKLTFVNSKDVKPAIPRLGIHPISPQLEDHL